MGVDASTEVTMPQQPDIAVELSIAYWPACGLSAASTTFSYWQQTTGGDVVMSVPGDC
jgi:hypothetical protein